MSLLIGSILAFLFLHRIVSGGPLRAPIAAFTGERLFRSAFAVLSFVCLAALWVGYRNVADGAMDRQFFAPPELARVLQPLIQFVAIFLVVCGVTTRNPTIAGLKDAARDEGVVRGIVRVTRHPFLWGISIYSLGHMLVDPTLAGWAFFGTLLFLAATGTLSIDHKRQVALGDDWLPFQRATSNVPFAAILGGRQTLRLDEIGYIRPAIAIGVLIVLMASHGHLFGVSALPRW